MVDAGLGIGASGLDVTAGVLGAAMGAGASKMFNTVGFLLAYELMTGSLRTKILSTDNSHTLGALVRAPALPVSIRPELSLVVRCGAPGRTVLGYPLLGEL